jgi:hypothetical protein
MKLSTFGSTASDVLGPARLPVTAVDSADFADPPKPLPCACTTYCRHATVHQPPLRNGYYCRNRSRAMSDQAAAEAMHEHRMRQRAIQVVLWIAGIILLVAAAQWIWQVHQ